MAEINLDDLLKAKEREMNTAAAPVPGGDLTAAPAQEIARVSQQVETLTPEQRQRVDAIKEKIDLTNSQLAVQYGVSAQRNIAEFADNILSNTRSKDSGYVGDLLRSLSTKVKGFNVDGSNDSFLSKIPIFGSLVNKAKDMMAEYDKLSVQVEKIQGELDKARTMMLKDIVMFDTMYDKNLEYFKELELYIRAGEEKINELKTITLPKLRQQAAASPNQMAVQLVNDFENSVDRFEKKVHDLKLSKTVALQTAPQIRLIQNIDKVLVDKVQSTIYNTIPLWKSQIVIALGLSRQNKVLQIQREVTNATNELLRRNAEMLKQGTIEAAKENERGIVDIETVKKVNDDIVSTIEETLKIQDEGRQRRQAAEAELVQIEDRLKQTLLTARR